MKTVGIIAEYNPFHQGHKYLIDEAKKITGADRVVVVMSGNTVQRGDFALVDEFSRARAAVENGADLVLELSYCFCSQSAEYFARGAIAIMDSLGIVDYLCYGSEHNDLESQKGIARLLNDKQEEILSLSKDFMKKGMNYPSSREEAARQVGGQGLNFEIMGTPNDILAIEYIRALYSLNSKIEPVSIQRKGADHNDQDFEKRLPSATAIRSMVLNKESLYNNLDYMPLNPVDMRKELDRLKEMELRTLQSLIPKNLAAHIIRMRDSGSLGTADNYINEIKAIVISRRDSLDRIFEVSEGVENAIIKHIHKSESVQDLAMAVKSKRFAYTRLRRVMINILTGLEKTEMDLVKKSVDRPSTRILAFNDKGRQILKEINRTGAATLINKITDFRPACDLHRLQARYDAIADELFYMKYKHYHMGKRVHFRSETSPLYIKAGNGE